MRRALFSGLQEHFLFGVVKSLGDPLHKEMKEACPRYVSIVTLV